MRICMIDRAAGFEQIPMRLGPLRRAGHSVDFIYSPWPQSHVRPYGRRLRPLAALNGSVAGHTLNKVLFALFAVALMEWRHLRRRYDVTQIEEPLATLLASLLPRRLRPAIVFSTMGPLPPVAQLDAAPAGQRGRLVADALALPGYIRAPAMRLLSANLRRADRVVVNSAPLRDALASISGSARAIDVVHAGADTHTFRPGLDGAAVRRRWGVAPAARVIIALGPIQPRKGQHLLVAALPRILAAHPETRLLLLGDMLASEQYRRDFQRAIDEHSLRDRVICTGTVPREELADHLASADVFAMISSAEGGVAEALLEAMSCGLACVVSDIPPNHVAAPAGDELAFVPVHDEDALVGAIDRLLADDAHRLELGRRARAAVCRHFGWESLADELVAVYRRALDEPGW